MLQISRKQYKKWKFEIIDKERYFRVNRKDLEAESDVANWPQIFDKCHPKKQKYRRELTPNAKFQQYWVFVSSIGTWGDKAESHKIDNPNFLNY